MRPLSGRPCRVGNRVPGDVCTGIVDVASDEPEPSPGEPAGRFTDGKDRFVSQAPVYGLLEARDPIAGRPSRRVEAGDGFGDETTAPGRLRQTDRPCLKVIGRGRFHPSTVLDDRAGYVIARKSCTAMKAEDVTDTPKPAPEASGRDRARSCVSRGRPVTTARPASPAISPEGKGMDHGRGAPHHRQTRGRIGRRHQTLKNRILPQNRYLPGDRESRTGAFADDRNSRRYRESLNDVTPADACFGKNAAMIESRPTSKRPAVANRRPNHQNTWLDIKPKRATASDTKPVHKVP